MSIPFSLVALTTLHIRPFHLVLVAALAGTLAGLTGPAGAAAQEVWPDDDWPRSTPEAQGLDPEQLNELVALIREGERFPDLHGLLIVRNGHLVVEEYFGSWNPELLHTLQSVSKSFTSALIGIAIAEGHVESVDERVIDFFPQWRDELAQDPRWAAVCLQDLLTMRSGTDYHERGQDSPHFQLNRTPRGWDRFYLDRPMVRDPGTYWQYDSGASASNAPSGTATEKATRTRAAVSVCSPATWPGSAYCICVVDVGGTNRLCQPSGLRSRHASRSPSSRHAATRPATHTCGGFWSLIRTARGKSGSTRPWGSVPNTSSWSPSMTWSSL